MKYLLPERLPGAYLLGERTFLDVNGEEIVSHMDIGREELRCFFVEPDFVRKVSQICLVGFNSVNYPKGFVEREMGVVRLESKCVDDKQTCAA